MHCCYYRFFFSFDDEHFVRFWYLADLPSSSLRETCQGHECGIASLPPTIRTTGSLVLGWIWGIPHWLANGQVLRQNISFTLRASVDILSSRKLLCENMFTVNLTEDTQLKTVQTNQQTIVIHSGEPTVFTFTDLTLETIATHAFGIVCFVDVQTASPVLTRDVSATWVYFFNKK